MANKIDQATKNWTNKVNDFTNDVNNKLISKQVDEINKLFGNNGVDFIKPDTSNPDGIYFHVNEVEFRNKLVVECPEFLVECGINRIDFGKVFLRGSDEMLINNVENVTNDVIQTINGVQQFISPATIDAIQNLLTFVVTTLITTVTGYCKNVFLRYVSPEFPISLATQLAQTTMTVTKNNIKTPDAILEEVCREMDTDAETIKKEAEEAYQKTLIAKINAIFSKTLAKINSIMEEIRPYSDTIARYMQYGPDYVCSEVASIFTKYLNMGISIVDDNVRQIDVLVNGYVRQAGNSAGLWAAELANKSMKKSAKKLVEATEKAKVAIEIKAKALVNKALMNLLAILGG